MNSERVLELLRRTGAFITQGHFVYTSGKHGSDYINKDALYVHTHYTAELCKYIALEFDNAKVEIVVGPAMGGIILSQWTTFYLQQWHNARNSATEILSVYAEKEGEKFVFKRGYEKLIAGKRVLVVEDLLNTGGSALKAIEAVRALGGTVVGLGVIANRGKVTPADVGEVPRLVSGADINMKAYDAETCPLCMSGIPINETVGHGAEFMKRKRA